MTARILLFLALLAPCFVVRTAAAERTASRTDARAAYLEELLARARKLELAKQVTWLRLIHYRHSIFGWKSEADAKSFFLSSDGRGDPEAELEATLRAFFGPAPKDRRLEHAFCRFPARLAWLNSKLSFDFTRMPRRACPRFQDYYDKVRPEALVLVFSSYYLNNPASAFGHTFLRIKKRHPPDVDESGLELLDYGIDYSANVDTNNALIYAVKGLTGLFPGVFRKVPYYLKMREYNDYESRDLWEYELGLSKQEVSMVVAHLWELGSTYFDYFYLSENCSYHILAAIEVANPRFRLLSRVGFPVIPADTVKAVQEDGLVRSVHYRPSNRTQFRERIESLPEAEKDAVAALGGDAETPLPREFSEASQARVLDAALDLVDFRYARDLVRGPGEEADPEGARAKQRLLERRAAVAAESEPLRVTPPVRKMPHLGHDSSRLGLGSGYLEHRGAFHTLEARLALHDLADSAIGYPESAAIEFLPIRARYYVEHPKFSIEDFSLIRVTSLSPFSRFERNLSWTFRVGATRMRDEGCLGCFAGIGELGGGYAVSIGEPLMAWLFADARVLWPVDNGGLLDTIRAGVGPLAGLRLRLGDDFALLGTGAMHWLPLQEPKLVWEGTGIARWEFVRDFALGVELNAQPEAMAAQGFSLIYF